MDKRAENEYNIAMEIPDDENESASLSIFIRYDIFLNTFDIESDSIFVEAFDCREHC